MKHINKLFRILILPLAVLLFTACQNEVNENSKSQSLSRVEGTQTSAKGITLKGQIKLSGAVPSRAATSSFDNEFYTWWITAQKSGENDDVTGQGHGNLEDTYCSIVENSNTFSLTLPKAGSWSISISGYAGVYDEETLPRNSQPLFTYDGDPVEFTSEEDYLDMIFYLKLNNFVFDNIGQEAEQSTGNINLLVACDSEAVKCVYATLTKYMDLDAVPVEISQASFTSGKSSLVAYDVPAGIYTAEIFFDDANGNTLYSCKEAITVYPGLSTDTWFGTVPYFKNGEFVLSSNMVEGYGADIVPNTNYVLYNKQFNVDEQRYVYQYYLVDDYSAEIPETMTASNSSESYNSLCFDSDGYYYILTKQDEDYICVTSNKPGFGSETASENNGAMKINVDLGNVISVDRATNYLYAFDKSNRQITRITKDDGSYDYVQSNSLYESAKTYTVDSTAENAGVINNSTRFTVYNNIAYFASIEDDKIAIINLDNTDTSMNVAKTVSLGLSGKDLSYNAICSDMLYQDGAVYMIIRDYNPGSYGVGAHSRGALLKYDVFTGTCTPIIDLVPTKSLTTFKAACGYKSGNAVSAVYNTHPSDDDSKDFYIAEFTCDSDPSEINFYTPFGSNLDSYFAGPQKFVAIKPKKLVISDTGIAFYTNDDGVVSYKNVNRIVEVDLKNLSISESTDVSVDFDPAKTFEVGNVTVSALPTKSGLDLSNTYYCYSPGGYLNIEEENPVVVPYFAEGL